MSYLIKKDNKTNTITYLEYDLKGYKFKPKNNHNSSIKINEIIIINPQMIDKILTIKFNAMFKKLMIFGMQFLNDDPDSTDGAYVLAEIDRLKGIILKKYQKYLSREKQKLFLDKLDYLENLLRFKNNINRQFMQDNFLQEEYMGKSR